MLERQERDYFFMLRHDVKFVSNRSRLKTTNALQSSPECPRSIVFKFLSFSEAGRKLRARVKELLLESLLCSPVSASKLLCGRALEQTDLHRTGRPLVYAPY